MTILVAPACPEPFRPQRVRTLSPEPSAVSSKPFRPQRVSAPSPEPRISIVTPSFNQGKFLEKTILSVLEQGYQNLDYRFVGNCQNSCSDGNHPWRMN